jgi:hypothetical protein
MKKPFLLIFIFSSFLLLGCKKETKEDIDFAFKTKPISSAVLKNVFIQLKNYGVYSTNLESRLINLNNDSLAQIMSPVIENGRQLHAELLSFVSNSADWYALAETTKDTIINMKDEQLAELSLAFFASQYSRQQSNWTTIIHNCVGVALGIAGLQAAFASLSTTPSISSAINILRWYGRRLVGYAAIAWMIWDFWDCMSSVTQRAT